jgi:hypothetical protein
MVPLPGCQVHSQKNPGNLICSRVHSVVLGRENNKTSRKGRRQWMLLPYVTVAPPKNGGTYVIKTPTLGFRLPCSKYLGWQKGSRRAIGWTELSLNQGVNISNDNILQIHYTFCRWSACTSPEHPRTPIVSDILCTQLHIQPSN